MKKLIIVIQFMLAICSGPACNIEETLGIDVIQPEVEYSSPSNQQTGVAETSSITIKFSEQMDTIKTGNSFSLSTNSGEIEGYMYWNSDGDILTFAPNKDLDGSEMYTISVSTGAEDAEGNDLKSPYYAVFYINNDLIPPEVTATTTPATIDGNIIININDAIDEDTLYDGITISPSVQGTFESVPSGTGTAVTFNPTYNLSYTTMYTVTVGTQLKDINGNKIQEPYSFNFTVGDDFDGPIINNVYQIQPENMPVNVSIDGDYNENSGMEKDCDIVIKFDDSIDFSTLNTLITFKPVADFLVLPNPDDTTARIQFKNNLESETRYTMKLSPSISDEFGNQMNKEHVYFFTTDGEKSKRPHVLSINGWDNSKTEPCTPSGSLTLDNIYLEFDRTMLPANLKFTVTREVGNTGGDPSICMQSWENSDPTDPESFKKYIFSLHNIVPGNVYKITVKGGTNNTSDKHGNFLKEDYTQFIEFGLIP